MAGEEGKHTLGRGKTIPSKKQTRSTAAKLETHDHFAPFYGKHSHDLQLTATPGQPLDANCTAQLQVRACVRTFASPPPPVQPSSLLPPTAQRPVLPGRLGALSARRGGPWLSAALWQVVQKLHTRGQHASLVRRPDPGRRDGGHAHMLTTRARGQGVRHPRSFTLNTAVKGGPRNVMDPSEYWDQLARSRTQEGCSPPTNYFGNPPPLHTSRRLRASQVLSRRPFKNLGPTGSYTRRAGNRIKPSL